MFLKYPGILRFNSKLRGASADHTLHVGFKHVVKECDDAQLPDPRQSVIIDDGDAVFHCLREILQTFVSSDMYKEDSVKGVERNRRGVGDKLILCDKKTKRSKDWKIFLANDENKRQFIQLLLSTCRSGFSADILTGHEMVLIYEGKAYQLTTDGHNTFCQEIHSLKFSQEEDDTHMILYWKYAKERGCKSVRVRSPDSDIFFILINHARFLERLQILFETAKGNTRRCINVTKLSVSSTPILCSALLGYHAFIGCDSTSAFKEKGLKVVETDQSFQKAFSKFGEYWEVDEEVMNEVECFVCVQYGYKRTKKGQYIATHKLASKTKDEGHGWTMEAGIMKPKWTEGEVMFRQLVDILEELEDETSDPDSDSELRESDFLDRVGSDSDTESDGDDY
uniref:Uncharacterized protein n=1 Tax=Octopus bimaculoides TaxID=37653 RepID=A0A0L8H5U3_OCTBM